MVKPSISCQSGLAKTTSCSIFFAMTSDVRKAN